MPRRRTIKVDYLARVEGEGALDVLVENGRVSNVDLRIFEPPRFFEAFLQGRDYSEAPDITARICGICPVAYQMSSVHAMERAFGVAISPEVRALRRLLYCGEWIESHGLHIFFLHAPDFLGYEDAIAMAADHRDIVETGLAVKKIGNDLMTVVGGREIHPVNVRVGGFYRAPTCAELAPLAERLKEARDRMLEVVRWTATLPFPEFERSYVSVALRHPDEYPFNEGRVVSNSGLDISADAYEEHFEETHVARSNALQSTLKDVGDYLVGPIARFNLNFDQLPEVARDAALGVDLQPPVTNPFRSIIVRAVETLFACDEAVRLIEAYEPPDEPAVSVEPSASTGSAATEAPRGLLYHRYKVEENGAISQAKIVPPTSQNQRMIEEDLRRLVESRLDAPKAELTAQCEHMIRNYDPCISCATHFLNLTVREA